MSSNNKHFGSTINISTRVKSFILLFFIIISTITALPIMGSEIAGAVNVSDGSNSKYTQNVDNLPWQIDSYLNYKYIHTCLDNYVFKDEITAGDALSGKWFPTSGLAKEGLYAPYLLDTASTTKDTAILCTNNTYIAKALETWAIDGITLLCNIGIKRIGLADDLSIADCLKNRDISFKGGSKSGINNPLNATMDKFEAYIKYLIYGYSGSDFSITPPAIYIYYRHSLNQTCLATESIDTTAPKYLDSEVDINNSKVFSGVRWIDDFGVESKETAYISSGIFKTTNKLLVEDLDTFKPHKGANTTAEVTCKNMVTFMNNRADDYKNWRVTHPNVILDIEAPGLYGKDTKSTCGDQVSGVGWILCPVIAGLTKLNDSMWGLVSNLLKVDPLSQSDSIYGAWGTIRNLANIVFVIIFMVMIFSQLSSAGITNYGVKKLLPRLLIGAILVNVSFIVVQILVDLANIVGSSLYDVIVGLAPVNQPSWEALVNLITTGALGAGLAVGGIALAGGAVAAFWMLLPMALMGALGLLAAVITLIFRQAIIPILAILAPLAFVAYLLPNTEKLFKKWKEMLMTMLLLYPLAALVFGGSQFAANTIIGDGKDWWKLLIGLIMLTLPLFSLPFLASKSGALVSKVGGVLNGLAGKAKAPIGKWTGENASRAKITADNRAINSTSRFNPRRALLRRKARLDEIGKSQQNELGRGKNSYMVGQVANNATLRQQMIAGAGPGAADRLQQRIQGEQKEILEKEIKDISALDVSNNMTASEHLLRLSGGGIDAKSGRKIEAVNSKAEIIASIRRVGEVGGMGDANDLARLSSSLNFKDDLAHGIDHSLERQEIQTVAAKKMSINNPAFGGASIAAMGTGKFNPDTAYHDYIIKTDFNTNNFLAMHDKAKEEMLDHIAKTKDPVEIAALKKISAQIHGSKEYGGKISSLLLSKIDTIK